MKTIEDTVFGRRQAMAKMLLGAAAFTGQAWATHPGTHTAKDAVGCEHPGRLRLAFIPKSREDAQVRAYGMLAQTLSAALDMPVEVVPAASYSAVVQGLQAGKMDVAELGPATYVQMLRGGAVARPFAAMVREAGALTHYQALLVVRTASRWRHWEDLRGATLNLVDPASTSGALLPRQAVKALTGEALDTYFSRVSYAGSHTRALDAVREGRVDAAFVSSERLEAALLRKTVAAGELRVLWTSQPLPTDPLVLRKNLCPSLQAQLHKVFVEQQYRLLPVLQALGKQGVVAVDERDYADVAGRLGFSDLVP